jgi:hypothetical protein
LDQRAAPVIVELDELERLERAPARAFARGLLVGVLAGAALALAIQASF